ncbi:hypothetical protein CLOM_g20645 [Closterium sp. NIES-68]|nr:hypothetical protein CLOM_g20645 [Closterium sp. NIES-68]
MKTKHRADGEPGAYNGDAGASPDCIVIEESYSVSCHAEAYNGTANNENYDPERGHASGGEESDGSCSSYCSDDSSCSRGSGKGGGVREKREGGRNEDGGENDLINFQFVSASGESEGDTWIEAVHMVLPPVIPRSSSQATMDALFAPSGTTGMEPILDAKWEAGFKRTKRVFRCLLLLGCLLYIAAFMSGIIVNSTGGTTSPITLPSAASLPSHTDASTSSTTTNSPSSPTPPLSPSLFWSPSPPTAISAPTDLSGADASSSTTTSTTNSPSSPTPPLTPSLVWSPSPPIPISGNPLVDTNEGRTVEGDP